MEKCISQFFNIDLSLWDACENIWATLAALHLSENSHATVSAMISLWIQIEIYFQRKIKETSLPVWEFFLFYGINYQLQQIDPNMF